MRSTHEDIFKKIMKFSQKSTWDLALNSQGVFVWEVLSGEVGTKGFVQGVYVQEVYFQGLM